MKYKLESSFRLCQAEGESEEQRQMAEAAGERQRQDIIIVPGSWAWHVSYKKYSGLAVML